SSRGRIGVFVVAKLRGRGRQREEECGAGAEFTFGSDSAAVGLDNVLHDCEAKTGTPSFSRTCLVDPIEALEDAVKMFRSDTGAKVLHEELDLVRHGARANTNASSRLAILDCVFDEIAQDLVYRIRIYHHESVGSTFRLELYFRINNDSTKGINSVANQLAGSHGLRRELVVRAFNTGKSQQIFGETIHPICIFEDNLQELK